MKGYEKECERRRENSDEGFFGRSVELLVYIPYLPAPSSFKDFNRSGKEASTQD